jgi:hypothetical protein
LSLGEREEGTLRQKQEEERPGEGWRQLRARRQLLTRTGGKETLSVWFFHEKTLECRRGTGRQDR